jgi:hypothetical protein
LSIRIDPTNDSSPIIKKRFKPVDNPPTVLEVLQGLLIIKQGMVGVTTLPLVQTSILLAWMSEGTALRKFNEFAIQA